MTRIDLLVTAVSLPEENVMAMESGVEATLTPAIHMTLEAKFR